MNHKFKSVFCLLCLCSIPVLFPTAFESGMSAFAASTQKNHTFSYKYKAAIDAAKKHRSFSVQFTQEFYSILRDRTTISEGKLEVEKPASFRFEISSPRKEIYLAKGDNFWKYVPELKHAQHLRTNSKELSFLSLLTEPEQLSAVYKVEPWKNEEAKLLKQSEKTPPVQSDAPPLSKNEKKDEVLLKLTPKGDKQQKVLYAVVDIKTGFITELRIVQMNGNRTRFIFSNYSEKPIPATQFDFVPPPGIAIDNAS